MGMGMVSEEREYHKVVVSEEGEAEEDDDKESTRQYPTIWLHSMWHSQRNKKLAAPGSYG
jgi:hypothetical protein